jgi:hypothetical protein
MIAKCISAITIINIENSSSGQQTAAMCPLESVMAM